MSSLALKLRMVVAFTKFSKRTSGKPVAARKGERFTIRCCIAASPNTVEVAKWSVISIQDWCAADYRFTPAKS